MGNTAKEKKWDAIELGPIQNNFYAIYPTGQKKREKKKEAYSFIQKGFTNPKKSQKNFNFNKKQLDF